MKTEDRGMRLEAVFDNQSEAEFAVHALRTAARVVRQIRAELGADPLSKGDHSPVTIADFCSQAIIARLLMQSFPDDVLVAEEDSTFLRSAADENRIAAVTNYTRLIFPGAESEDVSSWIDRGAGVPTGRFWALDPIDGTKGFVRGDQYVLALALIEAGVVTMGVLALPVMDVNMRPGEGSMAIAVRGQGSWKAELEADMFQRMHVSDCHTPATARILRSYALEHTNPPLLRRFEEQLCMREPGQGMDSQAKSAVIADGGAELILRVLSPQRPGYREKIWDQAAGSILVEEAGGRVTDLDGKALDFSAGRELVHNRGVLVSNGVLHDTALETIRELEQSAA